LISNIPNRFRDKRGNQLFTQKAYPGHSYPYQKHHFNTHCPTICFQICPQCPTTGKSRHNRRRRNWKNNIAKNHIRQAGPGVWQNYRKCARVLIAAGARAGCQEPGGRQKGVLAYESASGPDMLFPDMPANDPDYDACENFLAMLRDRNSRIIIFSHDQDPSNQINAISNYPITAFEHPTAIAIFTRHEKHRTN
jgi:hypothetical protein